MVVCVAILIVSVEVEMDNHNDDSHKKFDSMSNRGTTRFCLIFSALSYLV